MFGLHLLEAAAVGYADWRRSRRAVRPRYASFHTGPLNIRAVPAAPVQMAFRHCPTEGHARAARIHPDGSATCDQCHTHIPAVQP